MVVIIYANCHNKFAENAFYFAHCTIMFCRSKFPFQWNFYIRKSCGTYFTVGSRKLWSVFKWFNSLPQSIFKMIILHTQCHRSARIVKLEFLAYGTRISAASTSGAAKCHLTPPCKTSRVRWRHDFPPVHYVCSKLHLFSLVLVVNSKYSIQIVKHIILQDLK